jgi:hypothetical protein
MGDLLLADMNRGGGFGAAVGTIVGGINALANNDWKSVGKGAAWGYLAGVVLGAGVAMYEGPRMSGWSTARLPYAPAVVFQEDSRNDLYPAICWRHQF